MQKKYQVFISSTYIDLIEERHAAVEAILKAGHIPAGMELFKSGRSQLETIKSWIDESDIYLLILGKRYGSIDPESNKSYTQLEYEYALSKDNFPIFSIILKDEYVKEKLESDIPKTELYEEDNETQYEEFLNMVKTQIVSFAGSIAEVKLAIHENIPYIEKTHNLDGWIRASLGGDENIIKELNEIRKVNNVIKEDFQEEDIDFDEEIIKEIKILGKRYERSGSGNNYYSRTTHETANISYKTIFCSIAPHLLEHPNDAYVKMKIEKIVVDKSSISDSGTFNINDEVFQKIKIHLTKLGLITTRYSKTTKGGMALFWSLSNLGKKKMVEWIET